MICMHLRWIPERFSDSLRLFGLGLALVFLAQSATGATLIGDHVDFELWSEDVPQKAQDVLVVDPGVEFVLWFGGGLGGVPLTDYLQVDVGASTITLTPVITAWEWASSVLLVSDLDWVDFPSAQIAGATVQGSFSGGCIPPWGCGDAGQPSVTLSDGHTVRIAFDANSPEPLGFTTGDVVTINLIPGPSSAVEIDIKPGSCPNSWNRESNRVLPVAILGTEDFDVTQIDLSSVTIRRAGETAAPEKFSLYPMAGTLNGDVFQANFVDHDPSSGLLDWDCTELAGYDGNRGTDTGLRSFGEQLIGVPIYAALDGTVIAAHDGEDDMNVCGLGCPDAQPLANGVTIYHGNGRLTRSGHMKKNSVRVSAGQTVRAGEQIGDVGSSGLSFAPHLDFEVYDDDWTTLIDPYAGPCRAGESEWVDQTPIRRDLYLWDLNITDVNVFIYPDTCGISTSPT